MSAKSNKAAGRLNPTTSPSPSPSRRPPSAVATPQAAPRGPLPATAESSYHKRVRTILLDHKRCRKEWNELVLRGCLGRARAAIELWTDIEIGLRHVDSNGAGKNAQRTTVRAGYLFAQSARLSEQLATLAAVLTSLTELLATMNQLSERAESLVIEAAKTRGTVFAFREALWVTWPLARFADGLQSLTAPYAPSLALIHTLLTTLTTFPPLPTDPGLVPSPPKSSSSSSEDDAVQRVVRPKAEEIQAAMSLLAVQPLIPGRGAEGPEAWEEVMGVEVGGWA